MLDPDLVQILCCPETRQSVRLADKELVSEINSRITSGQIENLAAKKISEKIEGGLVREDGKILYPIRENIPVMLRGEAISLTGISQKTKA